MRGFSLIWFGVLFSGLAVRLNAADLITPTPDQLQFFETRVRPVLVEHCYKCHSAESEKIKGKLRVDSREFLLKGGEIGPAVVPGDPAKSKLIEAVQYGDEDLAMPPKGKLPDAAIADLVAWIKMGAPWPEQKAVAAAHDKGDVAVNYDRLRKEHWSFKPIANPPVPAVIDKAWLADPLDAFVLARLEGAGIKPAEPAGKRSLIRRIYLDLIGLPPTPEEVDAFLADSSPAALANVVDRLLASPRFGERWGRHWLDVARYAESSGGSRSNLFTSAWRYRDYVIDSYNADKPFEQFVREQVAGDLLPAANDKARGEQLIATGFLALGPKNLDTQDKELLRMDVVDEQIDTMGRALLGLSLGCARCHDHKFDPVTTHEYYALAGIFRSTKTLLPGNVSGFVQRALPAEDAYAKEREAHASAVADLEYQIRQAQLAAPQRKETVAAATADNKVKPGKVARQPGGAKAALDPKTLPGIFVDDSEAALAGSWTPSTYSGQFVRDGYHHDGNANKGEKHATFTPLIPKAGEYEVRLAYVAANGRSKAVPVTIRHAGDEEKTVVIVDQSKTPTIEGFFTSLGRFRFDEGQEGWVRIDTKGTTGHVIADAVWLVPIEDGVAANSAKVAVAAAPTTAPTTAPSLSVKEMQARLAELKKKVPPPGPMAVAVQDEPDCADHHVCIRGNPRNLGEKAPRSFLAIFPTAAPAIAPRESGRRELAEWLVDRRNPLPARVYVNRVWHHLMGAGIVRSPDDFGLTGDAPTHPALLDHLATTFTADGGSTKRLIRRIVLSRTYAMSSMASPDARKADPENRLFSRQNRKRLEGEAIRDAILMASGQLDLTAGGSTLKGGSEFAYKFEGNRRSVYLPVLRMTMHDVLEAFDFADPNLVTGRRSTSTLATQALLMMNSPFAIEQSNAMAERLLAMPGLDDAARIDRAYAICLARPPTARERELATAFLSDPKRAEAKARAAAWAQFCQVLFASVDFRYAD